MAMMGQLPSIAGGRPVHSVEPQARPAVSRNRISTQASRARLVRWLVISAVATAAAIVVGTGLIISTLRNHALGDSRREIRNLAYMLAEACDRSIQAVELVQRSVVERMEQLGIASVAEYRSRMSGHDAHLLLKDTIGGLPHVETLSFFDPHGKLIK
jgi:hypothetical protein